MQQVSRGIKEALRSSSAIPKAATAAFLIAAALVLYWLLFASPTLPFHIAGSQNVLYYLAAGQRMYQGELIYRDFFEFVPPGTALVHFLFFELFELRLWIPNLLILLSGLALLWVGVVISRKLMSASFALLPSTIYLLAFRRFLPDFSHHCFSMLAVMLGIAVVIDRRTPARIAAAGFFCGLSACFTQTRGFAAVLGFAIFLLWESCWRREGWRQILKREAMLASVFAATLLLVNGYFIWQAGPARFLWCTIVYPLRYYGKWAPFNSFRSALWFFPDPADYPNRFEFYFLSVKAAIELVFAPAIFILVFIRCKLQAARKPEVRWEPPMLVAIVGFFTFLSILNSPGGFRVVVSILPALILLCWLLDCKFKTARILAATCAVGMMLFAMLWAWNNRSTASWIVATSQGRLALTAHERLDYDIYTWVGQHTHPSEYFYESFPADLYFYFDLRNPTSVPVIVNNGYTTIGQVNDVMQGIERHHVRYVCWGPSDLVNEVPDWEDPADAHLAPLRSYIHSHYKLVKTFGEKDWNYEIWERATE